MSEEQKKIEGTTGLFEEIKSKGIKYDNWCGDLYIPATDETTEIMKRRGIYGTVLCVPFRSGHPKDKGALWYEIPFAYTPYAENKHARDRH